MIVADAIEWLESHIHVSTWAARSGRTGDVDLSLDRMRQLAAALDDPQRTYPVIHVSGTNGKGSTSRMITRILMAEGLRVGTYSSPHLAAYNERFRLDDTDIDDVSLAALLTRIAKVEAALGHELMPFEILTGAAFAWFADRAVDVAVVEVGVLGRFDATNVADGRVAVVTNIGFDHTSGEGDWALRIASEKAGVVKPGAHLVLGQIDGRLESVFRAEGPAAMWRAGHEITVSDDVPTAAGRRLTVTTPWQTLAGLDVPLHGPHQSANAALAVAAASAYLARPLQPARVAAGVAAVRMPARLETVRERPRVVLDGAHNPDAARALAVALRTLPCVGRRTLIVGMLTGRDPARMLTEFDATSYDEVITCTAPTARARPAGDIAQAAATLGVDATAIDDVEEALARSLDRAGPDDQIVVTGSIYLVADARALLLARPAARPPERR